MKQRRFFAWLLMVVCMVMLTATIIPHHHHHALLCFARHAEVETVSCDSACEHESSASDEATPCQDGGCVAVFHNFSPSSILDHVEIQASSDILSFLLLPFFSLCLFFSELLNTYSDRFIERLHSVFLSSVQGLRAPPYLFF